MKQNSLREAPLSFRSSLADGHEERALDTLNVLPYAEALADFIHGCETPMTIGIQGEPGIGKTSLMNMLRGVVGDDASGLLRNDLCQVVDFETWQYAQFNQDDQLAMACMQALADKVRDALADEADVDQTALEAAHRAAEGRLQDAYRASSEAGMPGNVPALMIRFRAEFEALVGSWTAADPARRIVVFVDDLDQVRPVDALQLLEAIKNFLDVPGCVFLLALDYDVVQEGVAEKLGEALQRTSGKAVFDKIIQLPFEMPTASYSLENYISGLLDSAQFPFAGEINASQPDLGFFKDVALCTVGRNPRNIKRVINYANLLERIRERQGGKQLGRRDAQILFALVCMQVAWPELFRYFVNDPTVDTVTSLQNWAYLESLPEAGRLFARTPDAERLKNQVATFFDTLFSLLDENDDGQVDQRELQPVLDVMALACMTAVDSRERPRDAFISRVRENNVDKDPLVDTFLDNVFTKSIWYLGSECRYRATGARYVTIVFQGQQIGSLVSLRSQPFVFRLAMSPEKVRSGLKAYWKSKQSVRSEAITLTRSVFGKEASMTGFGDTVVDYSQMTNMSSKDAVGLLNALFRIVTGDELPEWELERDEGRKK